MIYPVIIVGGGFSGLVLMNMLIKDEIDFLLLEKNDRVGKKILATGNGRGNVSNVDLSVCHYHGGNPNFVEFAIKNYDNGHIAEFFEKFGVPLSEEDGKLYPLSKQSNSVLDALRLSDVKGRIKTSSEVTDVTYDSKTEVFRVVTGSCSYYGKNVVLAVGGKASPQFGTDGKSYLLAQKFGHKITPLYPSLVQLTVQKGEVKGLKGIKEKAKVTAFDGDVYLNSASGDILFTDNGISGNTVFYLSAYLIGKKNPVVYVDYIPEEDLSKITECLKARRNSYPALLAETFLSGIVHSRIARKVIVNEYGEDYAVKRYKDITDGQIEKLVRALKEQKFVVTGNCGFQYSQVTKGGVCTDEVKNETMQSKFNPRLYIIGEVLDVDGDCGGYNLQWAFSSAMCAYRSIKDSL